MNESESALREFGCALCGEEAKEPLFAKRSFTYVSCRACGFVYVSPRHAEFDVANEPMSGVRLEYRDEDPGKLASRRRKYLRRLRRFERFRRTNRLLEIGCREGHFLATAAETGWDVAGVEPSRETAAAARDRTGAPVHAGFLETAGHRRRWFDVVYLSEVVEHVDRPVPLFHEIHRVLRPGGVVWVKTGNVRSLSRLIRGSAWSYFAYRDWGHVSYFSPRTLRRAFETVGLRTVALRTWGIEVPRGPFRTLLGPVARIAGLGGHMEAIAERPEHGPDAFGSASRRPARHFAEAASSS